MEVHYYMPRKLCLIFISVDRSTKIGHNIWNTIGNRVNADKMQTNIIKRILNPPRAAFLQLVRYPDFKYKKKCRTNLSLTVCPMSVDPLYVVTYYIKWVTISWTYSKIWIPLSHDSSFSPKDTIRLFLKGWI